MLELQIDEQLPSYAVGDVPSKPLVFELEEPGTWTGVETNVGTATIDAGTIELSFDGFDTPGIVNVVFTLTDTTYRATCQPVLLVVEDPLDGWLTMGQVRDEWVDAPSEDVTLYSLLQSARIACETFAPVVDTVPENYRRAQLLQAVSVWTASRATSADRLGAGEFSVTVFPLDWNVKQLLRPLPGIPGMW